MNISAWVKGHKPEAALGAAGIAATVILALRARSANAASSNTAATSAPASTTMPLTTADTSDSDAWNGLEEQITGLQSAVLAMSTGAASSSGTPAASASSTAGTAPAAPAPTPTYGYGDVDTAQGEMIWLGTTGPGGSTAGDYQVGGGEPVYFGNAQSLAVGGTNQQGVDVYTPVSAGSLVSSSPG